MREKTKVMELDGKQYEFKRFLPEVGSYILYQLLGSAMKRAQEVSAAEAPPPSDFDKTTPEEKARAMVGSALFGGLNFETHKFVQCETMKLISRYESANGSQPVPVPLTDASGRWGAHDVRDDLSLVDRLEIECLVWQFSGFFEQEVLESFKAK
jgi:hypothetical protein